MTKSDFLDIIYKIKKNTMKEEIKNLRNEFVKKMESDGYTKLNKDQVSRLSKCIQNGNTIYYFNVDIGENNIVKFIFKYKQEISEETYDRSNKYFIMSNDDSIIICGYYINEELKSYFISDEYSYYFNYDVCEINSIVRNYLLNGVKQQ